MNTIEQFLVEGGRCYMLVDENEVGREKNNLRLAVDLARQKIMQIEGKMATLDDELTEYDQLQDAKNDLELLISGFTERLSDLTNRPSVG